MSLKQEYPRINYAVVLTAMMGEYVLYYGGRVVGGVYDNRLPVKSLFLLVRDSKN